MRPAVGPDDAGRALERAVQLEALHLLRVGIDDVGNAPVARAPEGVLRRVRHALMFRDGQTVAGPRVGPLASGIVQRNARVVARLRATAGGVDDGRTVF